jgi:hypothetical protein
MFFEGIRSERKLIETADLHVGHRWYLGYGFDEPLPDHSSLTRIRSLLGLVAFTRFFERVVEVCQEAGLVRGKELLFDATKVRANADYDSLTPRFYLKAKEWHHLHKFRLRGPEKVNVEGQLIAAGQNFKRWLKATGWGRRTVPGEALRAAFVLLVRPAASYCTLYRLSF